MSADRSESEAASRRLERRDQPKADVGWLLASAGGAPSPRDMNCGRRPSLTVMAGLVPAIHVFLSGSTASSWMPGTSPGMTTECAASRGSCSTVFLTEECDM